MNRRAIVVMVGMLWLVPVGAAVALEAPAGDHLPEVAAIEATSTSPGLDSTVAEAPSATEQRTSAAPGLAATSGPPDAFRSIVGMGAGLAVLIGLATIAGHRLERQEV